MSDTVNIPADFDSEWYRRTYPDVDILEMRPEEHYRIIGAALGRFRSAAHQTAAAQKTQPVSVSPPPPFPTPDGALPDVPPLPAIADGPIIPPPADLADTAPRAPTTGRATILLTPGAVSVLCDDHDLVRLPREVAETPAAMGRMLHPLALHMRLTSRLTKPTVQQVTADGAKPFSLAPDARPEPGLGCADDTLRIGPLAMTNAWCVNDARLRLMFGTDPDQPARPESTLRAWQTGLDGALHPIGQQALEGQGPVLCDLTLLNPLMPVFLELSDTMDLTLGLATIPFPSLLRGGLHAPELSARRPTGQGMETFWRYCDGLLKDSFGVDTTPAPRSALAEVHVDLAGATGAEPIFSADMRAWLRGIFDLGVRPAKNADTQPTDANPGNAWLQRFLDDDFAADAKAGRKGPLLRLPADSVPTLAVLGTPRLPSALRDTGLAGSFIVADSASRRSKWAVTLPLAAGGLLYDLQPATGVLACPILLPGDDDTGATSDGPAVSLPLHLSIALRDMRPSHAAERLMPVAPDGPSDLLRRKSPKGAVDVNLVVRLSTPAATLRLVDLLKRQQGCGTLNITVCTPDGFTAAMRTEVTKALGAADVGLVEIRPLGRDSLLDVAAATADGFGDTVLLADDQMLLADARVLQTLYTMLMADPSVATAACVMMRERPIRKGTELSTGSGGLFPMQVSMITAPQLVFGEPDCLAALPDATWPVAANSLNLLLVRRAAIRAAVTRRGSLFDRYGNGTHEDGTADIRFGLDVIAAGGLNLCTSAVRSGTTTPRPLARDEMDPIGQADLAPTRWDDILARLTLLHEVL